MVSRAQSSSASGKLVGKLPSAITAVAFLALYLPLAVVVAESFGAPGGGLTLQWYRQALSDQLVLEALSNSLWVGGWSTFGALILGTAAALAIQRARFPGRKVLEAITYMVLVMPEIVLGLSLLLWFVSLKLTLGLFCIILAHITFSVSYVIITVKGRLVDFDLALEDAARDLGASPWQAFWRVTFPLIAPAILAAGLIAFTLSFDDFLITFFTAGVGSDTLPLRIYAMIKFGVSPEIHALSSLMIAATLILVLTFFRRAGTK